MHEEEDIARKSFETFVSSTVKSLLIRRSPRCSLNLLFLLSFTFLSSGSMWNYVEKSLLCRGCKGWLNQESLELYIYIYTSFQVETRIKIGREEFRGRSREEFSGHAGSNKRMVLSLFALVLVAVKLNYLVKKATCTEIPYRNVFWTELFPTTRGQSEEIRKWSKPLSRDRD